MQYSPERSASQKSVSHADAVLELLARHPLLTRIQLAALLSTSPAQVRRVERQLAERGWLRPITATALAEDLELRRLRLAELTHAGRREVARRLIVELRGQRRYGLIESRPGVRRRLMRNLAHTVGSNDVEINRPPRAALSPTFFSWAQLNAREPATIGPRIGPKRAHEHLSARAI